MNTWKDKKNITLVLLALLCVAVIGCSSLLDYGTPARRHFLAAKYLEDPNSAGLTSLGTLKDDRTRMLVKYRDTQKSLLREAEDNSFGYKDAKGFIDQDIADAEYLQDIVVGSASQPMSLLGLLGGFAGGAAIFRPMKRKGDKDEAEVEVEITKRMQEKV